MKSRWIRGGSGRACGRWLWLRGLALIGAAAGLTLGPGACTKRTKQQQQSTSILSVFAPPSPEEAARWAVDPYNADRRATGTLLLANAPFGGESVYLKLYRQHMLDNDPLVRAVACRALGMHGTPEDAPAIVKQITDPERYLRWEAARALQRLHNPEAIDPLCKRLNVKVESEVVVREAAATALGQYPDRKVFDALVATLDDRDLAVSEAARKSLRTLTGRDLGDEIRPWVAWSKEESDLFAGQQRYEYPIFFRDPDWLEYVMPFLLPPNEKPGVPAGMGAAPGGQGAPASAEAASSTGK